ncbi:PQQ-binding-like beta-propeller repeat protein [Jatrophihabitans sp.]|uniref:outer membrane protein assembly factor BamB family protein n=1 Tax=Jatrophihabitans sp. TaxID=1932789 RepID=UPI002CFE4ED8|nr:PQQ-binding-like beta-propeller repeat protein [Jatrophihabitans sp.]
MTRRGLVATGLGLLLAAGCTSGSDPAPPAAPASSLPSSASASSSPPAATKPATTDQDWPTYHGDLQRTGVSHTMPAASGRLTATRIPLDGQVYASPIVVGGTVIVATERNVVYGLTPTGAKRWSVTLGSPTDRDDLPCGNIDPLGITGTPVYDAATKTVFVVASIGSPVRHDLVALDPATGAIRWRRSVDLPGADPQAMQQRGALTVLNGRVWVPFGGLAGDCGQYKGRLVGVPLGNGEPVAYTVPTTREAGIWTPPGATVLNGHLLVAVGNGESVGGRYDYSDSVLELDGTELVDSFSPSDWAAHNAADLDLGSQGPAVVGNKWIFIAGKDGDGYVLRAGDLGGIGGQQSRAELCRSFGGTAVAGDTVYVPCADGLRAVRIDDAGRLSPRWHAEESVTGSPVLGGGRLYSVSPESGVLSALEPATGTVRERVAVGATSRFATPAISGSRLFVPTLAGLTIVDTAR